MVRPVLFLVCSLLGSACWPETQIEQSDEPIVGGTTAAAEDYPSVGALIVFSAGQSAALCSATLIGPRLVLTAAHCVHPDLLLDDAGEPLTEVTFAFNRRVNLRAVSPASSFHDVREAVYHPAFDIDCLRRSGTNGCKDIAVAVLENDWTGLTGARHGGAGRRARGRRRRGNRRLRSERGRQRKFQRHPAARRRHRR